MREGADVVVRGLRGPDDVAFEAQMAEANRRIGGVETVFLICRPDIQHDFIYDRARLRRAWRPAGVDGSG